MGFLKIVEICLWNMERIVPVGEHQSSWMYFCLMISTPGILTVLGELVSCHMLTPDWYSPGKKKKKKGSGAGELKVTTTASLRSWLGVFWSWHLTVTECSFFSWY